MMSKPLKAQVCPSSTGRSEDNGRYHLNCCQFHKNYLKHPLLLTFATDEVRKHGIQYSQKLFEYAGIWPPHSENGGVCDDN